MKWLLALLLLLPLSASAQFNGCSAGFCSPKTSGVVANNLSLDGSAANNSSATSVSVTLSTTKTKDIIYLFVVDNGCTGGSSSVSDTAGLTWTRRLSTGGNELLVFWAPAATALTSDVITLSCTSGVFITVHAFAVNGANFSAPFDPNVSSPVVTTGAAPTITTTNTNTMLIGGYRCSMNTGVQGAGFTLIFQFQFGVSEYMKVTSPQSGTSVPLASGCGTPNRAMADAITQ